MTRALAPGDIILVELPSHTPRGHRQESLRPAVVLGAPAGDVRFPVAIVAPIATQIGPWAEKNPGLYVGLPAGVAGLQRPSAVLIDQVRATDATRIVGYLGTLPTERFAPVQAAVRQTFGH